jgi:hypothetical protein
MKDDAPPKDLQLRDAIRRLLVRYITRARQRVTNLKRKKRQPVRSSFRRRVGSRLGPSPSLERSLPASFFSLQLASLSWLSNWSILMPYLRKQGGT